MSITPKFRQPLENIWHSRLVRNVVLVASGTAGAQIINLIFMPLITRIYGPEAFGVLGTFTAIASTLTPIAALTYPIAIVLPREDRDALGIARLSLSVSLVTLLIAFIILLTTGEWLTTKLGTESISGYVLLIPLAMTFTSWVQIAEEFLARKKRFSVVARASIYHSTLLNAAKTGIGWIHPGGAVLIALSTFGHMLHAALLFIGILRNTQRKPDLPHKNKTPLKKLAARYYDFPLYRAPQNFINALSQSLPVMMLAVFFGPASAGFYSLAEKAVGRPTILFGAAVNKVFYPRITEAARDGENLPEKIIQATFALLAIGALPCGVIVISGPWVFDFVFGSEWAVAGEYARWLAMWSLAAFMNRPSAAAIPLLSIQRGFLLYEIFSVTLRTLAFISGYLLFHNDVAAIAFFAVAGILLNLFRIAWVIWVAYDYEQKSTDKHYRLQNIH